MNATGTFNLKKKVQLNFCIREYCSATSFNATCVSMKSGTGTFIEHSQVSVKHPHTHNSCHVSYKVAHKCN